MRSMRRSVILTHSGSEDGLADRLSQKGKTEASRDIDTSPKRASLLGLPRELRDMIYFKAVLQDEAEEIKISIARFQQPGICRVNKQLRRETLGLWYDDTHFVLRIRNLKFGPHAGHWVWTKDPSMSPEGVNDWENFKEWLRKYFGDRRTPRFQIYTSEQLSVLSGAFDIVKTLAEAGTEWETVDKVLDSFSFATMGAIEWED